jgi:primosomal protein N' (replication factor Y)
VTGGGKTAIYVEAIARRSRRAGRRSCSSGDRARDAARRPAAGGPRRRVALVHSGLGDGERADEWRRIRAGDVDIVVGTRLAVLAPLADVGS